MSDVGHRGARTTLDNGQARLVLDAVTLANMDAADLSIAVVEAVWQQTGLPDGLGSVLRLNRDLGRLVGRSHVVRIDQQTVDAVQSFATRNRKRRPSVVVQRDDLPLVSNVSLLGERVGHRTWTLRTAYFGDLALPEPWDEFALGPASNIASVVSRETVLAFWLSHAFVYLPDGRGFKEPPRPSTWVEVLATCLGTGRLRPAAADARI